MKEAILGIILGAHKVWVESFGVQGFRADLRYADLRYANLSDANLSDADLRYANLSNANLSNANLSDANLSHADLRHADLRNANLRHADLRNANLSDANLRHADLRHANLLNTNLRNLISGNNWQVFILQLGTWQIVMTKDTIAIGCQQHSVKDWFNFDDETISKMDEKAFEWWQINKSILQTIYKNLFKN